MVIDITMVAASAEYSLLSLSLSHLDLCMYSKDADEVSGV